MYSPELKKYIKDAQEFGLREEEIINDLTNAGWKSSDIKYALEEKTVRLTKVDLPIEEQKKKDIEKKKKIDSSKKPRKISTPSLIPLFIVSVVGLFIIIGAIYTSNLFILEIDKASFTTADINRAYNNLLKENKNQKILNAESSILFVGDIMLSEDRGTGKEIKKNRDYKYPFLRIANFLSSADLTFGNLEGPISSRGHDIGGPYSFRANPRAVQGLKFAGFDVLSIANNHIFNWGEDAFLDTISILDSVSIDSVGGGVDLRDALEPVVRDVNGTKVAFLAFSAVDYDIGYFEAKTNKAGKTPFSKSVITKSIKSIIDRNESDIIIVSLHWGREYKRRSSKYQQELAYSIIDAGADLIVGHHPHVVQEVEAYKNGWIAYSLGNFVFDQDFSEDTMEGLMLEVKIKFDEIINVNPISIKISDTFQPYLNSI